MRSGKQRVSSTIIILFEHQTPGVTLRRVFFNCTPKINMVLLQIVNNRLTSCAYHDMLRL